MDLTVFQETEGKALIEMLEANSDGAEEMDFNIILNPKEIADAKTEFAQRSIEEARILDDFSVVKAEHKATLKPISEDKLILLQQIKTGTKQDFGKCYKLIDHEEKMVGYYNNKGQLVYQRIANAEEAGQMTITRDLKKAE